jgi:hypothetical protein
MGVRLQAPTSAIGGTSVSAQRSSERDPPSAQIFSFNGRDSDRVEIGKRDIGGLYAKKIGPHIDGCARGGAIRLTS